MAQHDMNIANQGFPAFRADLNNALGALVSNSSGATAPSTTFAHQFWVDTAANPSVLKIRNADNDAWITIGAIDQTGDTFILRPAAGSVSAPAYSTSGDTNTGIFFPAADTIGLAVGGVEAARLVSGLFSVPANSTAASAVRLYEDTDNGTNYVDLLAPASVASNRTLTLPDNSGTIITTASTFAGTGPAFSAYQSVQQTGIGSGTSTKITFTTEEYDTASCYTNSRFTPNVEGYYQINASIQMAVAATTASLVAIIYKNGVANKTGNSGNGNTVAGGINAAANVSSVVYCNGSTDYIEIYAYGSNNGSSYSVVTGIDTTYFNGALVRAA